MRVAGLGSQKSLADMRIDHHWRGPEWDAPAGPGGFPRWRAGQPWRMALRQLCARWIGRREVLLPLMPREQNQPENNTHTHVVNFSNVAAMDLQHGQHIFSNSARNKSKTFREA